MREERGQIQVGLEADVHGERRDCPLETREDGVLAAKVIQEHNASAWTADSNHLVNNDDGIRDDADDIRGVDDVERVVGELERGRVHLVQADVVDAFTREAFAGFLDAGSRARRGATARRDTVKRLWHCAAPEKRSEGRRSGAIVLEAAPDRASAWIYVMSEHRTSLTARRNGPLKGRARVPGDKSISIRALILGSLTVGETRFGQQAEALVYVR